MKAIKVICVSLLSCLLLSLVFINSASAQTKPTMKVERVSGAEPVVFTGKVGVSFDLTLNLYDTGTYAESLDVYAWQVVLTWDQFHLEVDSVTFSDFMDTPRIGSWGLLTADAVPVISPATQYIYVSSGSFYAIPGAWGGQVLIQDDSNSEYATVMFQDGNRLHLQSPLANTYYVSANGAAYPHPQLTNVAAPVGGYRIMIGQTTKGAPPGVQGGSGLLCTITFNVNQSGGTFPLDIDNEPMGIQTYMTNTLKEWIGDAPSVGGDPGNYQHEMFKESGEFILPMDEDFDGDGSVAIFDLSSVALKYPAGPGYVGPEDLNDDGYVNIEDLSLVSVAFQVYANA